MRRSHFSAWDDPWRQERTIHPERPAPRRRVAVEPPPGEEAPSEVEPESEAEPLDQTGPRPALRSSAEALRYATEQLEGAKARVERDRQRVLDETRSRVLEQMLPVLDNLDRSIEAGAHSRDA